MFLSTKDVESLWKKVFSLLREATFTVLPKK